ncbi:3-methyl-2-oxobutanoate hydroxymethyltransferase [Candidatus Peregrinibacteria bacterium RIFOXYC2_FULL_33_13]|nr:MAG: 3-methyl-2-oxobutanoate hydroxymethyltransferase [Candidatus Peregrinibacteria bacterium GW2011_GWA2_33_10]KKP39591.1 MAG: ketopantoate hydroxymethyltransferase, 3-methyl-2-oxobutanoate hydroxymethyltransferase [Candidatus Peregrinibacteria bacterium GW2011_GWC2_33_13]OGJ50207.1 MAG: 3-methyl-2-oxobutanoate hydroxymethyltransferase [Candidatus Peregrinibacteria bacterium RIFOXYA2_FULL_33_7]OGJ56000.1 MAG: 3-methyl-2-oxobutanoate hydroxymethyltransferase [Candidatus Peregrinibacteria bact
MERIKSLKGKKKICALTCYDYPMAKILNQADIDMLLVGDSLGMVVFGYGNTHFVTLDDIICSTQAVMRGNKDALVVADMPITTCDTKESALRNCLKVVKETSVRAVKIEGKAEIVVEVVKAGINVLGHAGLKPQEVNKFKIQGTDDESRKNILKEALDIEKAGAFALILECVPEDLGKEITEKLKIPVIGIGAGRFTDGQILVLHDILGLSFDIKPKFVRKYADLSGIVEQAAMRFKGDVEEGKYPKVGEVY